MPLVGRLVDAEMTVLPQQAARNVVVMSDLKTNPLAASPTLFTNPLLDRLSRTHPFFPLLAYGPVVVMLLWSDQSHLGWPARASAIFAGYLGWTIIEYFGHRFLFHLMFPGKLGRRLHFLIHGVHHEYPDDPLRLVMPPLMSLPILAAAYLVSRLFLPSDFVAGAFAGFVAGYIVYDTLHYLLHHRQWNTRLGRELRRRHMDHHFRDDETFFGVSAPWWDNVFGTIAFHTSPAPRDRQR